MGNQGAKAILKGLNVNKILMILELTGNKVSDDILRQVNDFLVRNKNGDPINISQSLGQPKPIPSMPSGLPGSNLDFNVGKFGGEANFNIPPPTFASAGLDANFDDDFQLERKAMEERKLDLARELDEESRKRAQAEEDLERVKEEFLRKEIEDSRQRSELLARIDTLEQEKQSLQIKIMQLSEQYGRDDKGQREK